VLSRWPDGRYQTQNIDRVAKIGAQSHPLTTLAERTGRSGCLLSPPERDSRTGLRQGGSARRRGRLPGGGSTIAETASAHWVTPPGQFPARTLRQRPRRSICDDHGFDEVLRQPVSPQCRGGTGADGDYPPEPIIRTLKEFSRFPGCVAFAGQRRRHPSASKIPARLTKTNGDGRREFSEEAKRSSRSAVGLWPNRSCVVQHTHMQSHPLPSQGVGQSGVGNRYHDVMNLHYKLHR